MKILECVPNISEGRDREKIMRIAEEVKKFKGVKLLDVSPDEDHHRTVITFIGGPEGVKNAAISLIRKALELIDMRKHRGGHPRLGAVDVVPFVPIQGLEMSDAVEIAREVGRTLGDAGLTVFYYEEAATRPERRDLPLIRKGEYEGLRDKLNDPEWQPDEGPSVFDPIAGATVIGARFPLVAYNVNLKTEDLSAGKQLAKMVRFKDGGFPYVRAMAVPLRGKGMVQISMNLTRYSVTNIPRVLETIKEEALRRDIRVDSSEIIGSIPVAVLEELVQFYLRSPDFSIRQVIEKRILELDE
jgi:glutamate formiminotransferase / 5-formyltetrahydrofolate cyclo-ligase